MRESGLAAQVDRLLLWLVAAVFLLKAVLFGAMAALMRGRTRVTTPLGVALVRHFTALAALAAVFGLAYLLAALARTAEWLPPGWVRWGERGAVLAVTLGVLASGLALLWRLPWDGDAGEAPVYEPPEDA